MIRMRSGVLGGIVAAALVVAGLAAATQAGLHYTKGKGDVGEFKELMDRYCADWSVLDPDKAAPLYAKDPGLIFYDLAPFEYHGWSEYRDGVKKEFFNKMSAGILTRKDDLRVGRQGKLAWTTVTVHVSITWKDGKTSELDARHTAIWEKRGGEWLIIHEHVSAPLPES